MYFLLKHWRQQNFSHGKNLSQAVCLSFPCRKNMVHFKLNCYKFLNCPLKPTCFGSICVSFVVHLLGIKEGPGRSECLCFCWGKSFHAIRSVFNKPLRHENIQSGVVLNGMIMNSYMPTWQEGHMIYTLQQTTHTVPPYNCNNPLLSFWL